MCNAFLNSKLTHCEQQQNKDAVKADGSLGFISLGVVVLCPLESICALFSELGTLTGYWYIFLYCSSNL